MKISVITWDAAFRENTHTIQCFANQKYNSNDFETELIWVDFYSSSERIKSELGQIDNCTLLCLDHDRNRQWNYSKCVNKGVESSDGELLVVIDGDIVFDSDFLSHIFNTHKDSQSVTYFRRYDELKKSPLPENPTDPDYIDYLDSRSRMKNPTNYAGCFVIGKDDFLSVNGYEEHDIFSGPGMNAMEAYVRFRNAGFCIRWDRKKIYHPWHKSTGLSGHDLEVQRKLQSIKGQYQWISPYAGIEQSWVTKCREFNVDTKADLEQVDKYLSRLPDIDLDQIKSDKQLGEEIDMLNEKINTLNEQHTKDNSLLKSSRASWCSKIYSAITGAKKKI